MTNSRKPIILSSPRVLTSGLGFVFFAVVCLLLSQGAFAETVTVTGMNDATNYDNVDIVDNLETANAYEHTGTITGNSSLTVNATIASGKSQFDYRQWLKGSNGSYTFTGPITVNSGQLLINSGTLSTKTINLNGGDMYVMYADCLPHDATVNVGAGSMLDVEGVSEAIKGTNINIASGGSFRMCTSTKDDNNRLNMNIEGAGTSFSPGAIHARGIDDKNTSADIKIAANINLTGDTTISLENLYTGKQFIIYGTLSNSATTSSPTLTIKSDNAGRWIRLDEFLDMSGFSGNFIADNAKVRFFSKTSLGTGSSITVQNSATAYFNNTAVLNAYTGNFTVNNATIELLVDGKLNNLSGNSTGKVANGGKALTLNNTDDTTFNGVISGTGTMEKIGNKTLTLTAANTYTGKTTVSGGTLKLSGASAKLASTTIDVAAGTTLLYDNTFPHNTSPLTINVTNGTLEFYNTTVSTTHTNNGICSGVAGQDVTINGTGATFLIDGGGTVSAIDGTGKSTITFALDSNSVFHVKNGYFINGGYATQNWDNNKAELRIGATGKVDLWDGAQMKVGGLSGDAGAQITNISNKTSCNGISIGNGVTAGQSFTYNGSIILLENTNVTKTAVLNSVGKGTQTLNGDITAVQIYSKDGTLILGTANNNTYNDLKTNSQVLIKEDGGAVQVDGNIIVNSGQLHASGNWDTGSGKITVNSGAQLRIGGTMGPTIGVTLNGGLLFNDGSYGGTTATVSSPITVTAASQVQCGWKNGALTLSGGLNGSGNLTFNLDSDQPGNWINISGTGDYQGSITLKGKMRIGAQNANIGTETNPASATSYIGSKEITFNGGTLHNFDSHLTFSNDLNFTAASSLMAGWSKNMTFTGNIKGSGNLTVFSDSGWVIMGTTSSSENPYTGDVTIDWGSTTSMGQVRLAAVQPFGPNAGEGKIYGKLDMNGYSQKFKGLHSDTAVVKQNNKDVTVLKGEISNSSNNDSTLTLDITGYNDTYYGKINDNIELVINSDGAGTQTLANNGSTFTGNVVINGGTVKGTTAHSSYTTTDLGAFSTPDGRTITVNSGAELVLGTNDVLGGCNLSYFDENSVRLIVNGGKLSGTNNNPLYNATFQNGAEVYGNNNRDVYRSFWLMGTNTVSSAGDGETPENPVQFNGASGVIFVLDSAVLNVADVTRSDASDLVVNVILGNKSKDFVTNNSLAKTGSGTVELTKANEYTAGTTISEGVLKFTDDAVVANGPITVGANGTLEYNLSSGKTQLLTIFETGDSNNKIKSTGKVVKTGDGTLQICTSAAGQVDASSFVVSSGRLDMKEYFKGSLEVEAGATMSPGNSIGKLTVDGDFNLNGGTLLMEVAGPSVDDSDQLIVTNGTLIFGEGATIVLDFVNGMSPNAEFAVIIDAPNSNDSWVNYVDASYFTGLSYTQTGPDGRWVLSGHVDANAVPEPSTWALLALGVAGLMYWRKRKNA